MPAIQFRHFLSAMPDARRGRIAFASAAGSMTFEALAERTFRMAAWLQQEAGIQSGDCIAVCVPKSLEAVVVVHGVFVSGGAYVPLEFQAPPDRTSAILASLRPKLLITTPEMGQRLSVRASGDFPPMATYEAADGGLGLEALLNNIVPAVPPPDLAPDALAAIIFTSGSTGEPKGVMLSQRNMIETMGWVVRRSAMNELDRRISHTPLRFLPMDLLFTTFSGCRTYLLSDREVLFSEQILAACERERITIWNSTPTALRLLVESIGSKQVDLRDLRMASMSGEPLSIPMLRKAMTAMPNAQFANSFGATEASGMAFYRVPRPLPDDMVSLPLGTASDRYSIAICDEEGKALPPGEVGEITAVGPTVMLGYWNDRALTASRRLGGRADSYRTGDLGYLGDDGMLHLVGRRDQMVKLRGHRLDLGEVEALLKSHEQVRDAVAFVVDVGAEREVRTAVLTDEGANIADTLRQLCHRRLPAYGRPTEIRSYAEFPLLSGGKIDRKGLQELSSGRRGPASTA
jgi:L-proline---[L-prolyl-carrier protein] ligase